MDPLKQLKNILGIIASIIVVFFRLSPVRTRCIMLIEQPLAKVAYILLYNITCISENKSWFTTTETPGNHHKIKLQGISEVLVER